MAISGGQALRVHDGISQRAYTGSQKVKWTCIIGPISLFPAPPKNRPTLFFPLYILFIYLFILFHFNQLLTNDNFSLY